jgi:uncharacterized protein (DUF1501 family)
MSRAEPDSARRGWLAATGALPLAAALAPPGAAAQTFPARPIRIVVPCAAGGTSDILARTLGVRVGEALGQQIVVENKGVARARPGALNCATVGAGSAPYLAGQPCPTCRPSPSRDMPAS